MAIKKIRPSLKLETVTEVEVPGEDAVMIDAVVIEIGHDPVLVDAVVIVKQEDPHRAASPTEALLQVEDLVVIQEGLNQGDLIHEALIQEGALQEADLQNGSSNALIKTKMERSTRKNAKPPEKISRAALHRGGVHSANVLLHVAEEVDLLPVSSIDSTKTKTEKSTTKNVRQPEMK